MKSLVLVLLLAAGPTRLILFEENVTMSPGEVRGINILLEQTHAVIEAEYEVTSTDGEMTVALVGPSDDRKASRGDQQYLRRARQVRQGVIRFPASRLGRYQVILDSRANQSEAVDVRLSVAVIFDQPGTLRPAYVSPARQSLVIGSSLVVFLAICVLSGRLVLRSFRDRR